MEENWSNAKLRKKTWEEVEISVDGEEGDQAKEVVQLPFQSSPFITSFLYRACHSIHNIAAHTLDEVFYSLLEIIPDYYYYYYYYCYLLLLLLL